MGKYTTMLFSEIFEEYEKANNPKTRIDILRKYGNDNVWFREFLNYAFNPKVRFDITEIPQYPPSADPAGLTISSLNNEVRRLYIFIPGHPKRTAGKIDPKKESRILYALLTSLHKDEAALLVKLFRKRLDVKYLTARIVKEAFPNMPFEIETDEPKKSVVTKPVILPIKGEKTA